MNHHDAWVLRCLVSAQPLNGELETVSGEFREIAHELANLDPADRQTCWNGFLAGRADRDEIIAAMAATDPTGPAPEAEADAYEPNDGWGPLRLGALPPAEPFPLDVLPKPMFCIVSEAAVALGCDPGVGGAVALALAGGAIGRSASLLIETNRFSPAIIFQATISPPGTGKSPFLDYLKSPIAHIEHDLADAFTIEKEHYYSERKADKTAEPPTPVPRRVFVENVTTEALSRVLAVNPRGLTGIYDEYSILLKGLNQYRGGNGADRGALLKYWAGDATTIDRVTNEFGEPLRVQHPHLCLVGNMTPSSLVDQFGRQDDGLIDRWIFAFPERRPKLKTHERQPVSNEAVQMWADLVRRLWERPMDQNGGRPCPHVVHFTNAAKAEYDRLYDAHVDEVNDPDFPEWLLGPWSKLEEYARRFILILTLTRHASNPVADFNTLPLANISDVRDGWRLASYFKGQHRRVRACMQGQGDGMPDGARLVLNWIRNHPDRDKVTARDLSRVYPPSRGYDRASLDDGAKWLKDRNVLRAAPVPDRPGGTPGKKPAPVWEVHPDFPRAQQNQEFQQNNTGEDSEAPHIAEIADSAAPMEIE